MIKRISQFLRDEEGATAIEYGIIAGLMAIILVAVFNGDVKETLEAIFLNVRNLATGVGAGGPG